MLNVTVTNARNLKVMNTVKPSLRKLFLPVLDCFESGEGTYSYKQSHRTILLVVGGLFLFLSAITLVIAVITMLLEAAIPFLIFFIIGSVCLVIGGLGTDRAVARIWGNT
jgi:hypothetical protein